jgi:hypothetical protein
MEHQQHREPMPVLPIPIAQRTRNVIFIGPFMNGRFDDGAL